MSRVIPTMVVLIIVIVSGITAAPAFGEESPPMPETLDGVVGVAQLSSVIAGSKVMIECDSNKLNSTSPNTLLGDGIAELSIVYSNCSIYTVSKGRRELSNVCTVGEHISFDSLARLITNASVAEEELLPVEGETFVTVEILKIHGKICLLEGSFELAGSYIVSLGGESERLSTEHNVVFTSTGSKIKFGTEAASLSNELRAVKLVSSLEWDVAPALFTIGGQKKATPKEVFLITVENVSGNEPESPKRVATAPVGGFKVVNAAEVAACETQVYTKAGPKSKCTYKVEYEKKEMGDNYINNYVEDKNDRWVGWKVKG